MQQQQHTQNGVYSPFHTLLLSHALNKLHTNMARQMPDNMLTQ
jgi:hypothetical protein